MTGPSASRHSHSRGRETDTYMVSTRQNRRVDNLGTKLGAGADSFCPGGSKKIWQKRHELSLTLTNRQDGSRLEK